MAVIYQPSGTPTIIYGASDTTIDVITAGASRFADCTVYIIRYSAYTVVGVTQVVDAYGSGGVILPSDAQIGDVIELYNTEPTAGPVGNINTWAASGETINGLIGIGEPIHRMIIRKTSPTNWTIVSNFGT